ncbi:WASH complex WAHD domain protein (macronuclear) [Tetrahymena thermophila SB210]|uniref:WASH complex WAHD domain protein n=1 Tax=Tetrahymena thermophila (strain SB210) TaxID=312017 RepID=I7MAR6_TETTS|nr:WASH complex WAHD domain protein [Tetrahymena thermophila SB210]EAS05162.2 WASH complex WAHD domain protein [Tetrahymena thermophila SB210]|eukprot:XP_001025407.2 WASH complex WAHD domain protein [Tetrahymena thermophila SB210]
MVSVGNSIQHNKITMSNTDMSQYEGLEKTLSNLSMLDETLSYVIQRFDNQQNQYKNKIQQYLDRIHICQKKIAALQEQKKAITFVSPSSFVQKYKFTHENKKSILQDYKQKHNISKFETQFGYQLKNDPEQVGPIIDNSRPDDLYQILNISYGKFKSREKNPVENRKLPLKEKFFGVGTYPKKIKCAESLLVLNTNINPYRKYQQIDNLIIDESKQQQRVKPDDTNQINLQVAPVGISNQLTAYQRSELTYVPETKKVDNAVSIPLDFGLDGVAEDFDIDYGGQDLIQPSAWLIQNPTLPDPYANAQPSSQSQNQNNQQQSQQNNYQQAPNQNNQQNQQYQQYQNNNVPPAPQMNVPQAPSMNIPQAPSVNIPPAPTMSIPQAPSVGIPPPPPMGQMPAVPQQEPQQATTSSGGRGALLDEIRNPKIRLRKTVTVVKGGLNPGKGKSDDPGSIKLTSTGANPLDILKQKVLERHKSLNPPNARRKGNRNRVGQNSDESGEENSENSDQE